ncbi:hypothetical protein RvY_19045-7 [Ramazzottius varieornatus]|uniref:Receptor ligand binding region domain-containing protein n=1 Tax=Ramazzottius varieornatus TaxID=947166 RepID=A0A1D1W804_RAMVA|nr:hypothetical protein RvY_19045-7 [Ramazzottius varieornatus]
MSVVPPDLQVLACDEPENGRSCSTAQAVKRDLAAVLSDVEIVVFDGFTPSFNYIAALTVLSEKARVVIYSGMSKQAMRNILITAYNLNMTNGEYVRHVRGSDWAPRDYIFSEIKGALPLTSVVLG